MEQISEVFKKVEICPAVSESNQSSQSTKDLYEARKNSNSSTGGTDRLIQPCVIIFLKHLWGGTL